MITEDYVSFETAKLLNEKGFDWNCESKKFYPEPDYDQESPDGVYAPTLQTAMKWLREVHYLWIDIDPLTSYKWTWSIWFMNDLNSKMGESSQVVSTYKEACESAIKYCLENLI